MKIVHMCLSVYFVDSQKYQENILVQKDISNGHNVLVIASTETFNESGQMHYCQPSTYRGSDGAQVHRVPYLFGNNMLSRKLRKYSGAIKVLEKFQPDVIFFHGGCACEIASVAGFVRRHPHIRLFIDSHEDWNNSAKTWLSREILHRRFYRPVLRSAMDVCEKLLCISTETIDFMRGFYGIAPDKLELYPLAGEPVDDAEYELRRSRKRQALGAAASTRIFVQSGKQTARKRLIDSLKAFRQTAHEDCLFVIAGSLSPEMKSEALGIIESDPRIHFAGWCSPEELTDLLCAADVYVQPGPQSATMQHSLCCRCAVILHDFPAHKFYNCDNGWYVSDWESLLAAFSEACADDLEPRRHRSFQFAKKHLDYAILSKRYTELPAGNGSV